MSFKRNLFHYTYIAVKMKFGECIVSFNLYVSFLIFFINSYFIESRYFLVRIILKLSDRDKFSDSSSRLQTTRGFQVAL